MKQLIASTFVYRFQLLPSPKVEFTQQIDRQLHNYVWEQGRHRMRKELLWQPISQGGLGMINISIQNKTLKFSWFNRLFSDTVNIQFWAIHLSHCFILPLPDVLNCNIHYHELEVLLQQKLPCFWKDVFTQWFKQFFISPGCAAVEGKERVLSIPVVFNSEMAVGMGWKQPQLYELLKDQGVLLLKPFLVNFPTIFSMMNIVDPITATLIVQLRVAVPRNWNTIVTQSVANNTEGPCLITDRLFAGLLTPKAFADILLPRVRNVKAIESWQRDLDCEIELFLWDIINRKTKHLFIPRLRDFHVQFLNRAFHYNKQIAAYRSDKSEMCAFCDQCPETNLHLFWDCKFATPLWVALQDIFYEHVDDEDFSQFKCLLSNFQHPLLKGAEVV